MKQWKLHLPVYTVFSSCLEFSLTSSPFAFSMLQTLQQQKIAFLFFLNGTISNFCVLPVSPSTFCVRKTAHEEITVHGGTDSGNSGWRQDVDYLTCRCGDETWWGTLPFRSRWWFKNVACHVVVTTWWRSPFMLLWWLMVREVPFHVLAATHKEDHLSWWRGNMMAITLHTGLVIHDEGD